MPFIFLFARVCDVHTWKLAGGRCFLSSVSVSHLDSGLSCLLPELWFQAAMAIDLLLWILGNQTLVPHLTSPPEPYS